MNAIINRGQTYGLLNDKICLNEEIIKIVSLYLKVGKARLVLDTDDTLMYKLDTIFDLQIPLNLK